MVHVRPVSLAVIVDLTLDRSKPNLPCEPANDEEMKEDANRRQSQAHQRLLLTRPRASLGEVHRVLRLDAREPHPRYPWAAFRIPFPTLVLFTPTQQHDSRP